VYYSGLKEFIADDPRLKGTTWVEFDPLKWHETVPSGAIVFVDEAQKVFRNRALGTIPGKHVTELEEHRHKGLDFVLLTQHPSLIDPAIRRLIQSHRHMIRLFGFEASTVHFWDGIKDKPESNGAKSESQKTRWAFDKSLYGLYKSADVHTMKAKIPLRLKLLALAPFILGAAVWTVYHQLRKVTPSAQVEEKKSAAANPSVLPGGAPLPNVTRSAAVDPLVDAKNYAWKETPRVVGLPQTAPKYDPLTTPTRVPIPAMCVQRGSVREQGSSVSCKCYTQQATPMDVPYNMCIQFAQNGFFHDFDADRDRQEAERRDASQKVLENRPDAPVPQHTAGYYIPGEAMGPQRTDKSAPMSTTGDDGPPNNRATRAAAGAARAAREGSA
jgi:zona occludens toxin